MTNCHCVMVAYLIPGAKPKAGTSVPEVRGADTAKLVGCPMDLLMRCFHRTQPTASELPRHEALNLIIKDDEADGGQWVDKLRNSQLSLGEVVQTTLVQREAAWEIPQPIMDRPSAQRVPREEAGDGQQQGGSNRTRQHWGGKGSGGGRGFRGESSGGGQDIGDAGKTASK